MKIQIQQSQYSKDFSKALSLARLNGIDNVPPNRNSSGQWCWSVDLDLIDIEEIQRLSCDEAGKKDKEDFINTLIQQMPVECDSFDSFIQNISDNLSLAETRFIVEGDIVNGHYYSGHYIYDFLDNHDMRKAKKLFIYQSTDIYTDDWDIKDCSNRRINAIVEVCIDYKRAGLILKAIEIIDLGKCSRESEYFETLEKYNFFVNYKTVNTDARSFSLSSSTPRIALICGHNHSMKDFTCKLHKDLCKNLMPVYVNMNNIDDIAEAIVEVSDSKSADIICIVRGGGDAEDMCKYNHPTLLDAIISSAVPVITGLGHSDDMVLAQEVAVYGAATPTAAMEFLNRKYRELKVELCKDKPGYKKETVSKADYDTLQDECTKLQEENQKLRAEIERLTKRGMFSRLFNL